MPRRNQGERCRGALPPVIEPDITASWAGGLPWYWGTKVGASSRIARHPAHRLTTD